MHDLPPAGPGPRMIGSEAEHALEVLGTLERIGRNVEHKAAQLPNGLGLAQQFGVLAHGFVEAAELRCLLLAVVRRDAAGPTENHQRDQADRDAGAVTRLGPHFVGVELGHEKPIRVGHGPQIGKHLDATVVDPLGRPHGAQHRLDCCLVRLGDGIANGQGASRAVAHVVEEHHLISLTPHQNRFSGRTRCRPRLQHREQEFGRVRAEHDDAQRTTERVADRRSRVHVDVPVVAAEELAHHGGGAGECGGDHWRVGRQRKAGLSPRGEQRLPRRGQHKGAGITVGPDAGLDHGLCGAEVRLGVDGVVGQFAADRRRARQCGRVVESRLPLELQLVGLQGPDGGDRLVAFAANLPRLSTVIAVAKCRQCDHPCHEQSGPSAHHRQYLTLRRTPACGRPGQNDPPAPAPPDRPPPPIPGSAGGADCATGTSTCAADTMASAPSFDLSDATSLDAV